LNPTQKLLITGGTGSFGTAMLTQLLSLPSDEVPGTIVVFSRDEDKQHFQRHELNDPRLRYVVGDIRDRQALIRAFRGMDFVIHAAALKHVSTGELYPEEMIATNIRGSMNVIDAANACGVARVVFVSTDKAVYPINAYGMTKGIAEKLVSAAVTRSSEQNHETSFCTVRYGNVMGSRGSVIPLFKRQIAKGEPLTITDGGMTRFLLKLSQAVSLVRHALERGVSGRLYVKKSPACTVDALVSALEDHYKCQCRRLVVGPRPGEKMHETLMTSEETSRAVDEYDKFDGVPITAIRPYGEFTPIPDGDAVSRFSVPPEKAKGDFTSLDAVQLDKAGVGALLHEANVL
jgi:UDP-N-acetylglucosamine 4,6-dehydratase